MNRIHDTSKNDISFIRFGGSGAAGSEGWMQGQKMKPYMVQKLKTLLKTVEGDGNNQNVKQDNLEDMFD